MLDIGWSELLVIGIVALIVVGPKDLPILFRRMGEFTGKARAMAREFTSAMDRAADEAGVNEVRKDLRKIADPRKMGLDAVETAARDLSGLERDMGAPRPTPPQKPAAAPAATGATASAPHASQGAPAAAPAAPAPGTAAAAAAPTDDTPA